jgi:hypothetical protein
VTFSFDRDDSVELLAAASKPKPGDPLDYRRRKPSKFVVREWFAPT